VYDHVNISDVILPLEILINFIRKFIYYLVVLYQTITFRSGVVMVSCWSFLTMGAGHLTIGAGLLDS
jgi:hypothetical protein